MVLHELDLQSRGKYAWTRKYGNTVHVLTCYHGADEGRLLVGERLAVDPANSNIIYFGARSGNGLWKSTDGGVTFSKVTSFTAVGNYIADASDTTGYNSDIIGIAWVTFDPTSSTTNGATSRIFVGSASNGTVQAVWVSTNAGSTWTAVAGQPSGYLPHKGKIQAAEKALYITYANGAGPYDGTLGAVWRYDLTASTWADITPVSGSDLYYGFGGLGLDTLNPGTLVVAALNSWWPVSSPALAPLPLIYELVVFGTSNVQNSGGATLPIHGLGGDLVTYLGVGKLPYHGTLLLYFYTVSTVDL